VVLESVASIRQSWGTQLKILDWLFTILFTAEYLAGLHTQAAALCAQLFRHGGPALHPAALPGLVHSRKPFFADIRVLRLLRMFRILKLTRYMGEARELKRAMLASRRKILVFLMSVIALVIILGTLMYVIEGEANGFTSIPIGIYWAIVTLTTVGFGDITPKTPLGQALASMVMITGYGIIAVPTGIVTAEIARGSTSTPAEQQSATRLCPHCFTEGHDRDAHFCKHCGGKLPRPANHTVS
jgi:voltage-gated potassium channel